MDTPTLEQISCALDAIADYTADYPNTRLVLRKSGIIAVCMPDNELLVDQLRNWLINDYGHEVDVEIYVQVKPTTH